MRTILSISFLICSLPFYAQEDSKKPGTNDTAKSQLSSNEVDGLKLPTSQQVKFDEGFITVSAECKGTVQWLVLSTNAKVKYKINPATPNDIDLAIPPYDSIITLFAVGLVDGKLTKFARTDITVKGPEPPDPGPTPPPQPPPPPPRPPEVIKPLHLTIIEDPIARTPNITSIITSPELANRMKAKGVIYRVYGKNDPVVKNKGFDRAIAEFGLPLFILQDNAGNALIVEKLPNTLSEIYNKLASFVGAF